VLGREEVCACADGGSQYSSPALSPGSPTGAEQERDAATANGAGGPRRVFNGVWKQSVRGISLSEGLWKWL